MCLDVFVFNSKKGKKEGRREGRKKGRKKDRLILHGIINKTQNPVFVKEIHGFFKSSPEDTFSLQVREREREIGCEREISIGFLSYHPNQGLSLQPRYVP